MILQALNHYYDRLVQDGTLERPGWQPVKVSYALQINEDGQLVRVLPLMTEKERGKKKVLVPRTMNLPARANKTSGIVRNFICEDASYLLGLSREHDSAWSQRRFESCREFHIALLGNMHTPAAQSVVRFLKTWSPEEATKCEPIQDYLQDILAHANIVFAFDGKFIQEYPEIQKAWDDHYFNVGEKTIMRCLVTGSRGPIAKTHPFIHGIGDKATMTMVSFNAPAFESFGRVGGQGLNAPVSEKAAFAYSAALNYMIAEREHHLRLSDATIVFWAESGNSAYASFFAAAFDDAPLEDSDIHDAIKLLASGRKVAWHDDDLNPDEHFYILGLAPNAARLSVRFFMQDTFGAFARNMQAHHERLEIVRPQKDYRPSLSFRELLNETVRMLPNQSPPLPSPPLSGALVRSVLTGLPYPRLLLDQTELRIRAEHKITRGRAAIIKAFLLRNAEQSSESKRYKEVLTVELNENTNYQPYLLGRLFAVLESLQQAANPGINTTIRDRFFNSACATPGIVFPQLIKLAQAHLKKLDGGLLVHYNKQLGDILSRFDTDYPTRLSLYDQGIFQLGYYHQVQARYTKKEENQDV